MRYIRSSKRKNKDIVIEGKLKRKSYILISKYQTFTLATMPKTETQEASSTGHLPPPPSLPVPQIPLDLNRILKEISPYITKKLPKYKYKKPPPTASWWTSLTDNAEATTSESATSSTTPTATY